MSRLSKVGIGVLTVALFCTPALARNAARAVPVQTAIVQSVQLSDPIEALGTARANETVQLTASVAEKVSSINFGDGDTVQAGDVLVLFDMAEERAELAAAEAQLTERQLAYDRAAELNRRNVTSTATVEERQAQLQSAMAAISAIKARISDRTLTAPFSGQVGLREVSVGALVRPGDVITSLDDLSVMKVDFAVPALKIGSVRRGLTVSATSPALAGKVFAGKITSLNPQVDPVTRSIMVRAEIPNSDLQLVPGLLLKVVIEARPRMALIVPEAAIVPNADQAFVFVLQPDQIAKRQQVQLGTRHGGVVEVLSGLSEGDIIVTDGNHRLKDGDKANPVRQEP